ncbi:UDP-N-acetylglucosamine diphosphorylase/glucosamine-1-phosphate N-acetyltransferase [Neisseriaceae bacterium PsAf]|nr:UDP-N-acetylglucosamine diphosphorylase/glucosamine-1-phosphate N-acetyltransferase [Neisseriaceae bacterium PsAf]MCV2503119.1 bifunctional UDP-N-acetylglucosamine diphosphorylase/glucosamine-1-phosphate N-acetyltransferase GlmU [Neisseriaceae bacterium]
MQDLYVVILAAGQGTRMKSQNKPKVLHSIAGKPMLSRVIETAEKLNPNNINVVVGHEKEQLFEQIHFPVNWVIQDEQLGTGHAVKTALPNIPEEGATVVLYGDVPLIDEETLKNLISIAGNNEVAVLTDVLEDPSGYGRIIRNEKNHVIKIVEDKDVDSEQRLIKEINTGIYVIPNQYLHQWLNSLNNNNAQQEYYLTDIVALANEDNVPVKAIRVPKSYLAMGVNDKIQLATLERIYQREIAKQFMQQGLMLLDPNRFDLRGDLIFGSDVIIDVNVVFEGNNVLGNNINIGAHCLLKNVTIHDNAIIHPFSHLEDCEVGESAKVGPYARLRPKAKLAKDVHIGNFVEVKNSKIGIGSKVNHLTYVGDATIGKNSNIGAGTITCNYDGVNKHATIIGDDCLIGSGTMLVAPVTVGNKATTGAGSVITKNCPENQLTVSRSKQISLASWVRPEKENKS